METLYMVGGTHAHEFGYPSIIGREGTVVYQDDSIVKIRVTNKNIFNELKRTHRDWRIMKEDLLPIDMNAMKRLRSYWGDGIYDIK